MIRTALPIALGLILILSLSLVENITIQDRWGTPGAEAAKLGEHFSKVPKTIGDWEGEDKPVDEQVRNTAGAVSYVSRRYTEASTGRTVELWLIVGHSHDIVRHTPNICYPSSGFRQIGPQLRHHMDVSGEKPAVFYTGKFQKEDALGRRVERVFWAWNHPSIQQWESPDSARKHYGLQRALYKLYFTSVVQTDESTIEQNVSTDFASLMLPAIDAALFSSEAEASSDSDSDSSAG